jgi:hypothetical protein
MVFTTVWELASVVWRVGLRSIGCWPVSNESNWQRRAHMNTETAYLCTDFPHSPCGFASAVELQTSQHGCATDSFEFAKLTGPSLRNSRLPRREMPMKLGIATAPTDQSIHPSRAAPATSPHDGGVAYDIGAALNRGAVRPSSGRDATRREPQSTDRMDLGTDR